jgi:hypothetical protein
MGIREAHDRQAHLPHVVRALRSPSRRPSRLHGRQQKPDEDTDDGDHDEQLDEGECGAGHDFAIVMHMQSNCKSIRIASGVKVCGAHVM